METQNCRGQCALELVLVLIALTTVVLLTQAFAGQSRTFFSSAVLSRESR